MWWLFSQIHNLFVYSVKCTKIGNCSTSKILISAQYVILTSFGSSSWFSSNMIYLCSHCLVSVHEGDTNLSKRPESVSFPQQPGIIHSYYFLPHRVYLFTTRWSPQRHRTVARVRHQFLAEFLPPTIRSLASLTNNAQDFAFIIAVRTCPGFRVFHATSLLIMKGWNLLNSTA